MTNKKKILAAVVAATVILGNSGVGIQVKAADLQPFRVGCGDTKNQKLNDLAAVAQDKGYLEEELNKVGYTLEITGFAGQGPEISAALMSDSLDAGNIGDFPVFTSKAAGAEITVAAITNPKLTYAVMVKNDIKEPKDLEGKNLVVTQGTALQYAWEKIAEKNGVDTSKVNIINSNISDALSLLQTGDADGFVTAAYSAAYFEKQGIGHILETEDATEGYSTTEFAFSDKILKEHPETAVAVNKALIRAAEDVKNDPQVLYDSVGSVYGSDVIEKTYGFESDLNYLTPEFSDDVYAYLDELYNWMNDKSLLSGTVDIEKTFDSTYYQQAVEELQEQ